MAPNGRNTVSCRLLLLSLGAMGTITTLVLAAFHSEFRSAVRSLALLRCPSMPDHERLHVQLEQTGHNHNQQPTIPTTYSALSLLEDLPATNVLWIKNGTSEPAEAWGISMFHGLHCLKMWKESLSPETAMRSHVHGESEYAEHSNHCISYLVQAIACAADGTIEPAEHVFVDGKLGRRIHGMGYTHQCRDSSLLFEMDGKVVAPWEWQQGDTLQSVFGQPAGKHAHGMD